MARLFLGIVGTLYIVLALWCSFAPASTSRTVGFTLKPGSGQSEFLTVYGGLELALGIVFLWPLYQKEATAYALLTCLVLHACLVVFRTIGFFLFADIDSSTYSLAIGEWVIFLLSLGLWLKR